MSAQKKELIARLIEDVHGFRFCGPSDDPDEQTSVIVGYRGLVTQLKRLAGPLLPEEQQQRLSAIEVEIGDIYSAYDANSEIRALLPDIEAALARYDVAGVKVADLSRELTPAAVALQNVIIAASTGKSADEAAFHELRGQLLAEPEIAERIPKTLRVCRDLDQAREHVRSVGGYVARRKFVRDEFKPLLDYLEGFTSTPADAAIGDVLERFDVESVHVVWQRALDRRVQDPEGAITLARTLLETVCKHILDASGEEYDDGADLPKLYKLTAEQLRLSPSQHTQQIFRQILGSCQAVVEGLGALRNRLSDAHGKGKRAVKPGARHAELAVNLAGSMATFLIQTWVDRASSIN